MSWRLQNKFWLLVEYLKGVVVPRVPSDEVRLARGGGRPHPSQRKTCQAIKKKSQK
jgi:hypothetical protein